MTTKQKPKTILRREEVNIVWNMQYSTKNYVKQQENVTHNQKKKRQSIETVCECPLSPFWI